MGAFFGQVLLKRTCGASVGRASNRLKQQIDPSTDEVWFVWRLAKAWLSEIARYDPPPTNRLTGNFAEKTPNVEVLHAALSVNKVQASALT
jgi:hypothetical protein